MNQQMINQAEWENPDTVSAMKPETRKRRFAKLIKACQKGVRL